MAKRKGKKSKSDESNGLEIVLKPLIITKASIKDGVCNYTYKEQTGVNAGDKHAVTGQGLVHADMMNAFGKLNAHLAIVDDAFITADIEVERVADFDNHPLTGQYDVDSFEVIGTDDNEKVVIKGTKFVKSMHDRMTSGSPKIPLGEGSSHKFASDLKDAIELCRYEVEQYRLGKHAPIEDDNQMAISDVEFEISLDKGEM